MHFTSIYVPSYAYIKRAPSDSISRYWGITGFVLAIHCLVFFLLWIRPTLDKLSIENEIIINLMPPIVIPEVIPENTNNDRLEKKQSAQTSLVPVVKPTIVKPAPVKPNQAPQTFENSSTVKLNQEVINPIKIERVEDKPVKAVTVEKIEEKKITDQPPLKVQTESLSPVPAKEIAPESLPVLVDKKNKDKDAPEVAPPADSLKASTPTSSSLASTASSSQAGGSSSPTNSSSSEIQAQITPSKSTSFGIPGSNAANADADYRSQGLRNAQPRYPIYARKMRQEGVVIVSAEVLIDGSAGDVRVAISSGIKLLDEAALVAVKQWNFTPAKKDGVPYAQRMRIPVTFNLNSR